MIDTQLMSRPLSPLTVCLFAGLLCGAKGQSLYLLTGPMETRELAPISLFMTKDSGIGLDLVRTISSNPAKELSCSVSVDPGERLVAILLNVDTAALAASIDMDNPGTLQKATISYGSAPGTYRPCLKGFLARSTDGRLLQVVELGPESTLRSQSASLGRVPTTSFSILGVQIRPPVSDPKTEQLPWSYEGRIETSSAGWGGGMHALLNIMVKGGVLAAATMGPAALPYSLEKGILEKVSQGPLLAYWLEVNNTDWLSLGRTHFDESVPNGLGASFHDILDKSAGQWQTLRVPGSASVLKNFGDWFAGLAVEGKSTRESPGKARRGILHNNAYEDSPVDQALKDNQEYSPGLLYLTNLRTRKSYTIQTGEGDSEVLLIDNGTVYYRVNDSIFRAPIGPENVGMPVLIATDSSVPDVHWAFLGPPTKTATARP